MVGERRTIKIAVERGNQETTPREKMVDLITEKIPERPGENEPLLASRGMPDRKDHLHVVSLRRAMKSHNALAVPHFAAVFGLVFRDESFSVMHRVVHPFGIGLEYVQNQTSARCEMLSHTLQAIDLLAHLQQMMKRAKRDNHQPECFAQLESSPLHLDH